MDLCTTGSLDKKRACAGDLIKKLLTWSYSPFWEGLHAQWVHVFTAACTLADAIEELFATMEDLIAGIENEECTSAALEFLTLCVEDLVVVYGLDGVWKRDLDALATMLRSTCSSEEAAAIGHRMIPKLRERLADERYQNE